MVREKISTFAFYRYRYVLAYILFAVALGIMLIVAGLYLPGGLTDAEMRSALVSDGLNPSRLFGLRLEELVNLPYWLLQAGSISLFGISVLSIKLPSILLGFASALGILYLLNLWYQRNVAIVGATVAVTVNQFLLTSQAGEPGILYIFLTTMILIAASMIARRNAYAKLWVILGFVLAGISLYLPLNVYILLALLFTAVIHPHARHLVFKESSKATLAVGIVLFLLIISPLAYGIYTDVSMLRTLLGIPTDIRDIVPNAKLLFDQYAKVYAPTSGAVLTPVYGLGTILLVLLGLYRLVSAKYTTKSYIISFWLVLLVPLIALNPGLVNITFVPVVLLIALAIDYLIWAWYRLFPRNPYARIVGLLPLAVLMLGIVVSNMDRYVYGFHYDTAVYSSFSYDLQILDKKLHTFDKNGTVQLIVDPANVAFYSSYARHQTIVKNLVVSSDVADAKTSGAVIVERKLAGGITQTPADILVARTTEAADRFYLYKNN